MHFDLYVGIDYSGAKIAESHLPGLQVFAAQDQKQATSLPPLQGSR